MGGSRCFFGDLSLGGDCRGGSSKRAVQLKSLDFGFEEGGTEGEAGIGSDDVKLGFLPLVPLGKGCENGVFPSLCHIRFRGIAQGIEIRTPEELRNMVEMQESKRVLVKLERRI